MRRPVNGNGGCRLTGGDGAEGTRYRYLTNSTKEPTGTLQWWGPVAKMVLITGTGTGISREQTANN